MPLTRVVYHLQQIPGNSGWDVNGKRFFGSSHWKIPSLRIMAVLSSRAHKEAKPRVAKFAAKRAGTSGEAA